MLHNILNELQCLISDSTVHTTPWAAVSLSEQYAATGEHYFLLGFSTTACTASATQS